MIEVCQVRVIYGDTDAMGIVYYGNYFRWFEMGRVELLRRHGIIYSDLTSNGIHLPVIEAVCRYHKPARYDETLKIFSEINELKRARIRFGYRIESMGELITTGHTEHVFTDEKGSPVRPPKEMVATLSKVKDA